MTKPLSERPGYRERPQSALAREVGQLRRNHGLAGTLLITFSDDRVGVVCGSESPVLKQVVRKLGDRILEMIDDGEFDDVLDPAFERL